MRIFVLIALSSGWIVCKSALLQKIDIVSFKLSMMYMSFSSSITSVSGRLVIWLQSLIKSVFRWISLFVHMYISLDRLF